MQVFGLTIARTKALTVEHKKALSAVRSAWSWMSLIREPFAGAWQKNVQVESLTNILAFAAVYACVDLIAADIAKLRLKLVEQLPNGIWQEFTNSSFSPVLRKPNRYQTRIQFIQQWIVSKLLYGNAYILKERDLRGIVVAMYVLDPRLVVPLVADDGGVYYQLKVDHLSGLRDGVTVPASEIIHDRMFCPWHPLIGVSPIYACGSAATQGIRIQGNSEKFFANMSRPSGQLTAPGSISDENAKRLKAEFEANFGGANIGRLLVTGDGLKYEPMTIPANDAQLIEQLRWTGEDCARPFHVPLHKIGIGQPTLNNIAALNQDYYSQCLQLHIESLELLLDEGLGLTQVSGKTYGVELDLDGLFRMDPLSIADQNEKELRSGMLKLDEARARRNLAPMEGGDAAYLQQQNYSVPALAKRDALDDPFNPPKPAEPTPAAPVEPANPPEDKAVIPFSLKRARAREAMEQWVMRKAA